MATPTTPSPPRFRFDDVVVDCHDFSVVKGRGKVALTPRAFDVLRYLIEHGDRVVEKQELFEQVWKERFVTDNALTRAVKEIRQALGDNAAAPRYVETVPRRGYRFIAPVGPVVEVGSVEEVARGHESPAAAVAEDGAGVRAGAVEVAEPAPTARPEPVPSPPAARRRPGIVAPLLALAAALAAGSFLFYRWSQATAPPPPPPAAPRSVAVLPLKNLSGDPANEYFSDGMTEALITALSKAEGLKVISRGSVFSLKGKEVDPREAGRRLGAAAVVEGSVRQDADSVRVSVRLVSAEDGSVLWASDTRDHALGDIFGLQDEIARGMAAGLKVRLTGEGARPAARRPTRDVEAYQLYLKGRFFWNKRTEEGLRKGIEYFEQATERDPLYAPAYAGLADSYAVFNLYSAAPLKDASPRAKAAAERALALDDTLAEAHTALAYVKEQYEWDWRGAELEFRRAIELDPNYATAHHYYSEFLALQGRTQESVAHIERAHELDPLSLIINTELGFPHMCAGRWDEALGYFRRALEMDPDFHLAVYFGARCHTQKGDFEEALAQSRRAVALSGGSTVTVGGLGYVYAAAGRHAEARKVLAQLRELSARRHVSPYILATVHAGLGERDRALALLEKAFEERDYLLVMLKVDPRLDRLRADARFRSLLGRVGLAP